MNLISLVMPLPAAVAKTTGNPLPTQPVALDVKAKRFIMDMVASEVNEYAVAEDEVERIDALCDMLVYIADTCIRHGMLELDIPMIPQPRSVEGEFDTELLVYRSLLSLSKMDTAEEQHRHFKRLCCRIAATATVDLSPYLEEVAKSNASKIDKDGKVILNTQGKIMKPSTFVEPDLRRVYEKR